MNDPLSRRTFLRRLGAGSVALAASGYALSTWEWAGPASAATPRPGELASPAPGRTLVVIELAGGNDGLNTVVPHADPAYHSLRPTLGVTDPIDLDGQIGLHPKLPKLAARYKAGHVAIVEGVGYTPPNLSHFASLAVWWTADRPDAGIGWLGTYLDGTVGFDDPLAAIAVGSQPAPALLGQQSFATTITDATGLQPRLPAWVGTPDAVLASWAHLAPARIDPSQLVGQVERAVGLSATARDRLDAVLHPSTGGSSLAAKPNAAAYGQSTVADSLTLAAQLIRSPLAPRVVYITGVGDFDVHQGEAQRQPALLGALDDGIDGFFTALGDHANQVLVMTTSEFGRRPAENGSGTDHGTANAHFLIGPAVKGGRYGEPASLTKLDATNNVVPTLDFRSLYSTGLSWLGVQDTQTVLGGRYDPVPALA
jgi:uncharacterized protein (DUF1501 family)